MSLLTVLRVNIVNQCESFLKLSSAFYHSRKIRRRKNSFRSKTFKQEKKEESPSFVETNDDPAMPIEMKNPYEEEKPKCILCKYDIEPDYKNVRLLSQFVSRFTGRVYGRHLTGLCTNKQKKIEREIKKAQTSGLMGVYTKNPKYLADPMLFDIDKPFRVV